jgi:hypothetical protein
VDGVHGDSAGNLSPEILLFVNQNPGFLDWLLSSRHHRLHDAELAAVRIIDVGGPRG